MPGPYCPLLICKQPPYISHISLFHSLKMNQELLVLFFCHCLVLSETLVLIYSWQVMWTCQGIRVAILYSWLSCKLDLKPRFLCMYVTLFMWCATICIYTVPLQSVNFCRGMDYGGHTVSLLQCGNNPVNASVCASYLYCSDTLNVLHLWTKLMVPVTI